MGGGRIGGGVCGGREEEEGRGVWGEGGGGREGHHQLGGHYITSDLNYIPN